MRSFLHVFLISVLLLASPILGLIIGGLYSAATSDGNDLGLPSMIMLIFGLLGSVVGLVCGLVVRLTYKGEIKGIKPWLGFIIPVIVGLSLPILYAIQFFVFNS